MTKNETWSGLRSFEVAGHYFELLTASPAVDVLAFDADGRVLSDERAVSTGYNLDRRGLVGFARIEITTSGSQAVKFFYSDGTGGNKSLGSTTISALPAPYDGLGVADNADAQAASATAKPAMVARLQVFNGTTWDRLTSVADNADNQAGGSLSRPVVLARMQAWVNGTGWYRPQATTGSDGQSNSVAGLWTYNQIYGYNGSTSDLLRSDNIGGKGVLRVTERGAAYGASYKSITGLAANTAETVFSAASNTGGAIVWRAGLCTNVAAAIGQAALLAKTSAPATVIDGDPVLEVMAAAGAVGCAWFERPIFIASGKGLYRISTNAEANAQSSVLYTLL